MDVMIERRIDIMDYKAKVIEEIIRLDDVIWNMYYPDNKDIKRKHPYDATDLFVFDIKHILLNPNINREEAEENIIRIIKESPYGDEIMSHYIDIGKIQKNVDIRIDFEKAFGEVHFGSTLLSELSPTLTISDLYRLALLYKENKCRAKIEDLLMACKLQSQCADFVNGNLSPYIERGLNQNGYA